MSRLSQIGVWILALALVGARAEELSKKETEAAKRLYDAKCVKCHKSYDPSDYPEEEWRLWMAKMSKKAKLKWSEDKLLNRYLDARRIEKPPRPP